MFEFVSVEAVGRSGGILSIWDPSFFHRVGVIKNRRFLVVSREIRALGELLNVINVYAPNDALERRALWNTFLNIFGVLPVLWVIAGDFNDVREPSKRRNSEFVTANAAAFNKFIEEADLVEYQMGGGQFTYVSDHRDKFSKLDRFLVCRRFMNGWPTASLTVLAKECSDHRPVLLSAVETNFGHFPFRFFNTWLSFPGFVEFVESECGKFMFVGPADLVLMTKLRWLKGRIKGWLRAFNMAQEGELFVKKQKISYLDLVEDLRPLHPEELDERNHCRLFVEEVERQKMKDLQQKAKVQ
ncbi:uncharacterized protein LOC143636489 [Bidens hawaiensis]|uniref:uncharacterized protein LOC143636489 n=1 Tax=Bidens hawaiensis TaxID=980011 RepID=UPI00404A3BBD